MPDSETPKGFNRRDALLIGTAGLTMYLFADLLRGGSAAHALPVWHGGWFAPLNRSISVNTGFLATGAEHEPGVYHLGLDLQASAGDAVHSIGGGIVLQLQNGWPGQAALLRHTAHDGTEFLGVYGHIDTSLSVGQWVGAGAQVGTVHNHSAPHLHLGIRAIPYPPSSDSGSIAVGDPRGSNGFEDPGAFLTAHPSSFTIPAEEDVMTQPIHSRVIRNTVTGDIAMLHPGGTAMVGHPLIPDVPSASGAGWLAGQPQLSNGNYWIDLPNDRFNWELDRHNQLLAALDSRLKAVVLAALAES